MKASPLLLHALGLLLVAARAIHAYALSQTPHIMQMRVMGMVLTFTTLGIAAVACIVLAFGSRLGM